MLKFFVRRPITTLMFVLVWVVLGFVAFPNINIERTPALDFPMVTATFIYPGAAPQELESQVVKRAEDAMAEVSELKKITSAKCANIYDYLGLHKCDGGVVVRAYICDANVCWVVNARTGEKTQMQKLDSSGFFEVFFNMQKWIDIIR